MQEEDKTTSAAGSASEGGPTCAWLTCDAVDDALVPSLETCTMHRWSLPKKTLSNPMSPRSDGAMHVHRIARSTLADPPPRVALHPSDVTCTRPIAMADATPSTSPREETHLIERPGRRSEPLGRARPRACSSRARTPEENRIRTVGIGPTPITWVPARIEPCRWGGGEEPRGRPLRGGS